MWHFFLTKKLVPHYINPNRSLVQLLHLMLTGTVAFSSSPWEEPHPCLARQWWVSSHGLDEIEDCSEACRLTYLEEELPLVFLITFLLLLLSVLLATISTRSPVSSEDEDEKEENCDIWPRMVIILTDFWIFTKKLSIGDIFSHKNWCHLPLNSHESTKISIKKSPKSVTIYSLKMSPKLVKNKSPKKVKILVNQQHFYKKNHQNWWQFTHWKCHQNWWKIIHQKKWKF